MLCDNFMAAMIGRRSAYFPFSLTTRTFAIMSTQAPSFQGGSLPSGAKIGIVAARFNADIVDELLAGCLRRLAELGITVDRVQTFRVPGAFELPTAAQAMARTARFAAIVCLGAVVRGDTPHFEYVAGECARGIMRVSLDEALPVIFGVLTTNTQQQALDRIGGAQGHAGERAAEAAIEMAALLNSLKKPF
jgi:6,7-dimethyl-8-ribityllumazine synthase